MAKVRDQKQEFIPIERSTSLPKQKKKVSIAPNNPIPSTSTMNFQDQPSRSAFGPGDEVTPLSKPPTIPIITIPDFTDFQSEEARLTREDSLIELQNLELNYELQSVSSNDSDTVIEIETQKKTSKHSRTREPALTNAGDQTDVETCLSVVIERNDNSEGSVDKSDKSDKNDKPESERLSHSGIVLSPLQLGQ